MNKLIIIGNLTRAPELRYTQEGIPVCNFTVAVNRRVKSGSHPEADYVRVTAWRTLAENSAKYLDKGRKAMVSGSVSAKAYIGNDNQAHATLELVADDIEFLSPRPGQSGQFDENAAGDDGLPEEYRR